MSLFYMEWCEKCGFDSFDERNRAIWERYCEDEMRRPQPAPTSTLSGRILRTWHDDRDEELRRRELGRFWRIIFPRQPLRIVSG